MLLDEVDAATASATFLENILIHEIGHVLGIGTFWQGLTTGTGTQTVFYNGTSGNTEWRTLGGPSDGVPLEPDIGAHWNEGWFDTEIMTPSAEGPGGSYPLSRMTIGSLIDIGFTASLAAADVYALPGCASTCPGPLRATGAEGQTPFDEVVVDVLGPLPHGSIQRE
jgi:hypothetical protein